MEILIFVGVTLGLILLSGGVALLIIDKQREKYLKWPKVITSQTVTADKATKITRERYRGSKGKGFIFKSDGEVYRIPLKQTLSIPMIGPGVYTVRNENMDKVADFEIAMGNDSIRLVYNADSEQYEEEIQVMQESKKDLFKAILKSHEVLFTLITQLSLIAAIALTFLILKQL